MNKDDQNLEGLEVAYLTVYNRMLCTRVAELVEDYGINRVDQVCCELNPGNSVPCFWKVSELAQHYGMGQTA